jgi:hypothetical protein
MPSVAFYVSSQEHMGVHNGAVPIVSGFCPVHCEMEFDDLVRCEAISSEALQANGIRTVQVQAARP